MREIKFRGFDGHSILCMSGYDTSTDSFQVFEDGSWDYHDGDGLSFSGDCGLMQYTGLKDKNGRDLYEGDIYRCGYKDKYGSRNVLEDIRDIDIPDEFEIIGNIYENPGLLQSNKKDG